MGRAKKSGIIQNRDFPAFMYGCVVVYSTVSSLERRRGMPDVIYSTHLKRTRIALGRLKDSKYKDQAIDYLICKMDRLSSALDSEKACMDSVFISSVEKAQRVLAFIHESLAENGISLSQRPAHSRPSFDDQPGFV